VKTTREHEPEQQMASSIAQYGKRLASLSAAKDDKPCFGLLNLGGTA